MEFAETLFERSIGRARARPTILLIALMLYGSALLVGALEYGIGNLLTQGQWRGTLLSPTVILYILLIAPKLTTMENELIEAILPLAEVDDRPSAILARESPRVGLQQEMGAIALGFLGGIVIVIANGGLAVNWVTIYSLIFTPAVLGLLSWTVYASVVSVRVTAALLQQPLRVDVFDLGPFEVVGRSSLYLALAFVGGVTIALVFSAPDLSGLLTPEFWLINGPVFLMPVVIFFWNMYPTHKIIAAAKQGELRELRHHLRSLSVRLMEGINRTKGAPQISAEIQALIAYEERLEQVQTWPYDVSTLRSLVVSILVPGITVLAQVAVRQLLGG